MDDNIYEVSLLWPYIWPYAMGFVVAGIAVWVRFEVGLALLRQETRALWTRRREERDELKAFMATLKEDHKGLKSDFQKGHDDLKADLQNEMRALRDLFIAHHTAQGNQSATPRK